MQRVGMQKDQQLILACISLLLKRNTFLFKKSPKNPVTAGADRLVKNGRSRLKEAVGEFENTLSESVWVGIIMYRTHTGPTRRQITTAITQFWDEMWTPEMLHNDRISSRFTHGCELDKEYTLRLASPAKV